MVQSTRTTLVALLAIFVAPLACASDSASVVRGGRLYDNWSLEAKARAPDHPNPAFKSKQAPIAPADSWRCVTCHGWDYQGTEGIRGTSSREKTDPLAIAALLKDANHGYGELLSELDRLDLGNFVASGQTDMRKLQALALQGVPRLGLQGPSGAICPWQTCHGDQGGSCLGRC